MPVYSSDRLLPRTDPGPVSLFHLAFRANRVDACDVLSDLPDARRRRQFPDRLVEAVGPPFGVEIGQLLCQLGIGHCPQFGRLHSASSSSDSATTPGVTLVITLHLIGIFIAARWSASSARAWSTPPTSNMIRPGLTTATQNSGLPLPDPIRVSAGFCVTGLSVKKGHQTSPPRCR